jgi:hypothetical protein
MEPINTRNVNTGVRNTPPQSSSAEPTVKATNNKTVRPEFVSPKGVIDAKSGVYVVQFRNASTGNVNFQYPNKKVVAEYKRTDNLIPPASTSSQGSPSGAIVSGVETTSDKVAPTTTPVASNSSSSSSSGDANLAPLSTADNV